MRQNGVQDPYNRNQPWLLQPEPPPPQNFLPQGALGNYRGPPGGKGFRAEDGLPYQEHVQHPQVVGIKQPTAILERQPLPKGEHPPPYGVYTKPPPSSWEEARPRPLHFQDPQRQFTSNDPYVQRQQTEFRTPQQSPNTFQQTHQPAPHTPQHLLPNRPPHDPNNFQQVRQFQVQPPPPPNLMPPRQQQPIPQPPQHQYPQVAPQFPQHHLPPPPAQQRPILQQHQQHILPTPPAQPPHHHQQHVHHHPHHQHQQLPLRQQQQVLPYQSNQNIDIDPPVSQPVGILQAYQPPPLPPQPPVLPQRQPQAVLPLPFERIPSPPPPQAVFPHVPQPPIPQVATTNQPYSNSPYLPATTGSPSGPFSPSGSPVPVVNVQAPQPIDLPTKLPLPIPPVPSPLQPKSPLRPELHPPVPPMPIVSPQVVAAPEFTDIEEPAKTKRKILEVVDPNTGVRVDLSSGTPPGSSARKREPIPIVDPRSGAKVDALRPKSRGPVAIIDPNSGEQVIWEAATMEERRIPPSTIGVLEQPPRTTSSLSKSRNPVAIINPMSGEQVVPETAKPLKETPLRAVPPILVIPEPKKTSKAIPIVAPAEKEAERLMRQALLANATDEYHRTSETDDFAAPQQQQLGFEDSNEYISPVVSPMNIDATPVPAFPLPHPLPDIGRVSSPDAAPGQEVPGNDIMDMGYGILNTDKLKMEEEEEEEEEDREDEEYEEEGAQELLMATSPVEKGIGLQPLPPMPTICQGRSSSAPLMIPSHHDTFEPHSLPSYPIHVPHPYNPFPSPPCFPSPHPEVEELELEPTTPMNAEVIDVSDDSPVEEPPPSIMTDLASSSISPKTQPPVTLWPVPISSIVSVPPPSVKKPGSGKLVYTESFLRLMRNTAVPAPERLKGIQLAEIYVADAEGYARKAALFLGATAKPSTSRQHFAITRDGPTILQTSGISNIPTSWGRDAFATSSPTSLLMSNTFIQDFRQAMGCRVGTVTPPLSLAHLHPEPPQLQHRAETPFTKQQLLTKEEQLLKKIVGILNRVTPEKYDTLMLKLYEVLDAASDLITPEVLDKIIAQVHERALEQPNYSDMYAELCKDTCSRIQRKQSNNNVFENFRRVLLNMCQERFHLGVERAPPELPSDIGTEEREEILSKEHQFRKCSKGNIRFIGELFKRSMLSERIMHRVIKKLLLETDHTDPRNQDAVEVLCTLLSTAGAMLDHPKAEGYMAHYFRALTDISKFHKSARIKFLVLDIIDLRQNGWVQRKKEMKAVKLDEVERTLMEQQEKSTSNLSRSASNMSYPRWPSETFASLPPSFGTAVPRARRPMPPREGTMKSLTSPSVQTFRPTSAFSMSSAAAKERQQEAVEPRSDAEDRDVTSPQPPALEDTTDLVPVDSQACSSSSSSSSLSSTPSSSSSTRAAAELFPVVPPREESGEQLVQESSQIEIVLVEPEERLERKMGVILEEWEQCGHSEETAPLFLEEITMDERLAFLCSGIKFAVSANKFEKQRLQLVLLIHVLQRKGAVNTAEILSALVSAVNVMLVIELWIDVPGLWRNFSQVLIELLMKDAFSFGDLLLIWEPFFTHQHLIEGKQLLKHLFERIKAQDCNAIFVPEVATLLVQRLCQVEQQQVESIEDLLCLLE